LEFVAPKAGLYGRGVGWYRRVVLPRTAACFSRRDAYEYLPESVDHFPTPQAFSTMVEKLGFSMLATRTFLAHSVRLWVFGKGG